MNSPASRIHVTVAAVARDAQGRFLLVEERIDGRLVLNQPAGHLEPGESLSTAVVRETLEETGWRFEPEGLVGLYRWESPAGDTFLRTAFFGRLVERVHDRLDADIEAVHWLDAAALEAALPRHRSPLVWRCVRDYLDGHRHGLELLRELGRA